jgi:hypothetical protein
VSVWYDAGYRCYSEVLASKRKCRLTGHKTIKTFADVESIVPPKKKYAAMPNGPGCPVAGELTKTECAQAAAALGYTTKVHVGHWGHAPKGCFVGHPTDGWKHTYYNTFAGQVGRNVYKSLCADTGAPGAEPSYQKVSGGWGYCCLKSDGHCSGSAKDCAIQPSVKGCTQKWGQCGVKYQEVEKVCRSIKGCEGAFCGSWYGGWCLLRSKKEMYLNSQLLNKGAASSFGLVDSAIWPSAFSEKLLSTKVWYGDGFLTAAGGVGSRENCAKKCTGKCQCYTTYKGGWCQTYASCTKARVAADKTAVTYVRVSTEADEASTEADEAEADEAEADEVSNEASTEADVSMGDDPSGSEPLEEEAGAVTDMMTDTADESEAMSEADAEELLNEV